MNKIYKLHNKFPKDLFGIDKRKREKIEKALNKKFSDSDWLNYKLMILGLK